MYGYLISLPLTNAKPDQGEAFITTERTVDNRPTVACTRHGAMNKVSPDVEYWRCLACNIGAEWHERPDERK